MQPHSVERITDLHKVLTVVRVPGPYVLVAHSYGGLIAELYTRTYPKTVAGPVLVDVTDVFLEDRLTEEELATLAAGAMAPNPKAPNAERLGILRVMNSILATPEPHRAPVFVLTTDKPPDLTPATVTFIQRIALSLGMLAEISAEST
jgi:pimeloyl-ACP methyl ester carboxylesterase